MEHHTTTSKAEAERLLGVAEKLLREKDFAPCKDFALLAQETEPLLEGPEQILAIADVLLASNKRINNHHDWYAILQIPGGRTDDTELIKKQYRRLALQLHPDKNKYPSSDSAFGLVADAWAVLSDPTKKGLYDNELSLFSRVNLVPRKRGPYNKHKGGDDKLPVRRSSRASGGGGSHSGQNVNSGQNLNPGQNSGQRNFQTPRPKAARTPVSGGMSGQRVVNLWTACPYCYNLYEYPRAYEGCCLRCDSCKKAFTATEITSMPPLVPGREAYYCIWGFFPMGFVNGNLENGKVSSAAAAAAGNGFPNWMPPMFSSDGNANVNQNATPAPAPAPAPAAAPTQAQPQPQPQPQARAQTATPVSAPRPMSTGGTKKRGRPRKYPQQGI